MDRSPPSNAGSRPPPAPDRDPPASHEGPDQPSGPGNERDAPVCALQDERSHPRGARETALGEEAESVRHTRPPSTPTWCNRGRLAEGPAGRARPTGRERSSDQRRSRCEERQGRTGIARPPPVPAPGAGGPLLPSSRTSALGQRNSGRHLARLLRSERSMRIRAVCSADREVRSRVHAGTASCAGTSCHPSRALAMAEEWSTPEACNPRHLPSSPVPAAPLGAPTSSLLAFDAAWTIPLDAPGTRLARRAQQQPPLRAGRLVLRRTLILDTRERAWTRESFQAPGSFRPFSGAQ